MDTPEQVSPADWTQVAATPPRPGDLPLLVVHGNCQAESLRVLTTAALAGQVRSVRIPPVFEVTGEQVPLLQDLLRRTEVFITQPIVDDYRDLPLGTQQVRALLPAGARVAVLPVLRWSALMPTHAIIRAAGVGDPPGVPYHDLRVVAAAAAGLPSVELAPPAAQAVRELAEVNREQLRIRQEHHGTVEVIDLFEAAGAQAAWTINHPGNPVLIGVAQRALERLGLSGTVTDPGRTLLRTTSAPIAAQTLTALGLPGEPRDGWVHQDQQFTETQIAELQLAWYAAHPQVVQAGLIRHRQALEILGLPV